MRTFGAFLLLLLLTGGCGLLLETEDLRYDLGAGAGGHAAGGGGAATSTVSASSSSTGSTATSSSSVGAGGQGGAGGGTPPLSAYAQLIVDDGPIGYWRLGESSGKALDSSGNDQQADVVGSVQRGQPGAIAGDPADGSITLSTNASITFNTAPNSPIIGLENKTHSIEVWVQMQGVDAINADDQRIWLGSHTNGASDGFEFYVRNLNLVYKRRTVQAPNGSSVSFNTPNGDSFLDRFLAAKWSHVAVVYAMPAQTAELFLDGVTVVGPQSLTFALPLLDSIPFQVAKMQGGTARVDEVAIYDRALSAGEVFAHYQCGIGNCP